MKTTSPEKSVAVIRRTGFGDIHDVGCLAIRTKPSFSDSLVPVIENIAVTLTTSETGR
jgi:hypothetical protein